MEFRYSYKTSDGVRHEAEINAPSRDKAFAMLREQGIRPIRVVAKEPLRDPRGFRGRFIALVFFVLLVSLVVAVALWWRQTARSAAVPYPMTAPQGQMTYATARPRGQIVDFKTIDLEKTFRFSSERRLAAYAQPGIDVTSDIELDKMEDLPEALERPITIASDDSPSVRELKRMVTGLKDEARAYVRAGHGISAFVEWLMARQRMETDYRRQMVVRVKSGIISREEANVTLHAMSFPEID